ncbi:26230_t:CDS:10 [Gigaspora margarita]|uniref:26230_t:CDS:1 n=1 Tax=Gigaspora margarita TaxID=4874 RepID=A0ABM8VVI0_GIGMA|nr:26230_t:CDS:10 [Gigaspora margarita]
MYEKNKLTFDVSDPRFIPELRNGSELSQPTLLVRDIYANIPPAKEEKYKKEKELVEKIANVLLPNHSFKTRFIADEDYKGITLTLDKLNRKTYAICFTIEYLLELEKEDPGIFMDVVAHELAHAEYDELRERIKNEKLNEGSGYQTLGKDFVLSKYKDNDGDKPVENPNTLPRKPSNKENKLVCAKTMLDDKISRLPHITKGRQSCKNIKIFQITDKKSGSYNSIELVLHKPIPYLQSSENKVILANEPPFNGYKTGDKLAVDIDRTRFFSPNAEKAKIWSNSGIVAKVVAKDLSSPSYKNINIYRSEEFEGDQQTNEGQESIVSEIEEETEGIETEGEGSSESDEINDEDEESEVENSEELGSKIHPDFTEELQKKWEKRDFSYEETKEYVAVGLTPHEIEEKNTLNEEALPRVERVFIPILPQNYKRNEKIEILVTKIVNHELILSKGFTPNRTKRRLEIGLTPQDSAYAAWLRDVKKLTSEKVSGSEQQLREEYNNVLENYPNKKASKIYINKQLEGELDLKDYKDLEKAYISLKVDKKSQEEYNTKEKREQITELHINKKDLEGSLNLSDFVNLTRLSCFHNKLTELDLTGLTKLENNNLPEQDLSVFGRFSNLEYLYIGNGDKNKIKQNIYNHFTGSLKPLKNLTKLKELNISNTDIDSGLECLPDSLERLECSDEKRPENREYPLDGKCLGEFDKDNNKGKERKDIIRLNISKQELKGAFDCENLEALYCSNNQLTNLSFLTPLSKLKGLRANDNNKLSKQDLSSLKPLQELNKLQRLYISNTNLSEGLEYLPKSCEKLYCNSDYQHKSIELAKELDKSSRATTVVGGILTLVGQPIIGGVMAVASPFVDVAASQAKESYYDAKQEKWNDFLEDADTFLDNYHELLGILAPIEIDKLLEGKVSQEVKELSSRTDEFLKMYDEDENEEISLEELIKERDKLARDLNEGEEEKTAIIDYRKLSYGTSEVKASEEKAKEEDKSENQPPEIQRLQEKIKKIEQSLENETTDKPSPQELQTEIDDLKIKLATNYQQIKKELIERRGNLIFLQEQGQSVSEELELLDKRIIELKQNLVKSEQNKNNTKNQLNQAKIALLKYKEVEPDISEETVNTSELTNEEENSTQAQIQISPK